MLVIGSGAREHALALRLAASPSVARVLIAPGNGGTLGPRLQPLPPVAVTPEALVALAARVAPDLVVIGPEAPLAAGVVDALTAAGFACFGPTRAAAEIESSKAFAKAFMGRHGIPTARAAVFADLAPALAHVRALGAPVVVKASGLAAGKGVCVCDDLAGAEAALTRFAPLGPVLVEERLYGEELSIMAFTDGQTLRLMPPAQDHKAAYDGDRGPTTGGMGAHTPVPAVTPALLRELEARVLAPAVRGLAAEGRPFRGVLYAGVMLTADGPRVLEFNARLGDPEASTLLPLLEGDLADVLAACVDGRLADVPVTFAPTAAATVVLASAGYPGPYDQGFEISGITLDDPSIITHHAGTRRDPDGRLLTAGGRVLAVTGHAPTLAAAVAAAYGAAERVEFTGKHLRRDIAHRALGPPPAPGPPRPRYTAAGVDLDAARRAVAGLAPAVRATFTPHVLSTVGHFGGLFDSAAFASLRHPVLVASTDGVGTKVLLAARLERWDGLGADLVHHAINDILVQGARPLFFLDYLAAARLDPARVAAIVAGVAAACRAHGCALLGGETAEMPGVYAPSALDLVGTLVGVVERDALIDGRAIAPGDVVLALPSSGLHTNGYSLARAILADVDLHARPPELAGASWADALLAPHRSYLPDLERLWAAGLAPHGLVHITGGGLLDNPPRVLPPGAALRFDPDAWPLPPLFRLLLARGDVPLAEARRVFNLGLGMLVIVAPADADRARAALPELLTVGAIHARAQGDPAVSF